MGFTDRKVTQESPIRQIFRREKSERNHYFLYNMQGTGLFGVDNRNIFLPFPPACHKNKNDFTFFILKIWNIKQNLHNFALGQAKERVGKPNRASG
jgi:hypothetical protein